MDTNPFVKLVAELEKTGNFFVPRNESLASIYRHFEIPNSGPLFRPQVRPVLRALFGLWNQNNLEHSGLKFDSRKVDGVVELEGKPVVYMDALTFQYVKGFISKPYLNLRLKRALHGGENTRNPFNAFSEKVRELPDVTYLPNLHAALGVSTLEESGLTAADYASAFGVDRGDSDRRRMSKPDSIGRIHFPRAGPIGITEETKEATYLESLPPLVVKALAQRVQTLRQAGTGKMPLAEAGRDVLQSIVSKDIKGKELIGLCIQNKQINNFCNQDGQRLFRDRLLAEFNEPWEPGKHGYPTPRELYAQMHKLYFDLTMDDEASYGGLRRLEKGKVADYGGTMIAGRLIMRIVPDEEWTSKETYLDHELYFVPLDPKLSFIVVSESSYDESQKTIIRLIHSEFLEGHLEERKENFTILDLVDTLETDFENDGIPRLAVDFGISSDPEKLRWLEELGDEAGEHPYILAYIL